MSPNRFKSFSCFKTFELLDLDFHNRLIKLYAIISCSISLTWCVGDAKKHEMMISNTDKFSFGFKSRKNKIHLSKASPNLVKFRIRTQTPAGWSRSCRSRSPRWTRLHQCTLSDLWWLLLAIEPEHAIAIFAPRWTTAVDLDLCANSASLSRIILAGNSMGFQVALHSVRRGELHVPIALGKVWCL